MINKPSSRRTYRWNLLVFVTFTALLCLAWSNRFIQDDAFISFRYADNFAHGRGLVYNTGERVEGYTNFLWTLFITIPHLLDLDPVGFSFTLSILFFAITILITYKMSGLVFNSKKIGLLTVILLGTNYTFSCYATGGLETQLQCCLFTTSLYILLFSFYHNFWKPHMLVLLSLLLSAAVLTRLDSVLLVITVLPVALFCLYKEKTEAPVKYYKFFLLWAPLIAITGTWLLWKLSYYGEILPNTFYAKVSAQGNNFMRGLSFISTFIYSYVMFPFLFLGFIKIRTLLRQSNAAVVICLVLTGLWVLYIVKIGGDFMEFRFMVPIMPMLFILIVWLIFFCCKQKIFQACLVVLLIAGSANHSVGFGNYINKRFMHTIEDLHREVSDKNINWCEIGKALRHAFKKSPQVTIATTAAGAIPYYSGLKTIDALGLNDKWIARKGIKRAGGAPGHQKTATLNYLKSRNVNFVIGPLAVVSNPVPIPLEKHARTMRNIILNVRIKEYIPPDSQIVIIPVNERYSLAAFYLTRSADIDAIVQNNKWFIIPAPSVYKNFM